MGLAFGSCWVLWPKDDVWAGPYALVQTGETARKRERKSLHLSLSLLLFLVPDYRSQFNTKKKKNKKI